MPLGVVEQGSSFGLRLVLVAPGRGGAIEGGAGVHEYGSVPVKTIGECVGSADGGYRRERPAKE